MTVYKRHQRVWGILQVVLRPWIIHKFSIQSEPIDIEGPVLFVSNHVTTWDPLIVATSLKKKQVYYVASEHIFRLGFLSKIIVWLVGPISRRKGASAKDTTEKCLEHLHQGHSIWLFAEGEQSWDGRSKEVIRGTGKLVKDSNVTLVTYRIDGGFLSLPRWADTIRKGKVKGKVVGIYYPEELKKKTAEEINEIMNRDIYVDAWETQRKEMIHYRSDLMAEHLERMLYLCPKCKKDGTLHSNHNRVYCDCGFETEVLDTGFFKDDEPFETLSEWEDWQKKTLIEAYHEGNLLFEDAGATLMRIGNHHETQLLEKGILYLKNNTIIVNTQTFALSKITRMAMTRYGVLLFTYEDIYYQIRLEGNVNVRKYLEIWNYEKRKR